MKMVVTMLFLMFGWVELKRSEDGGEDVALADLGGFVTLLESSSRGEDNYEDDQDQEVKKMEGGCGSLE